MSVRCHTLLQEADLACQTHNWSVLSQLLSKILGDTDPSDPLQPRSQPLDPAVSAHCLDLALKILESGDFQVCWEAVNIFTSLGQPTIAPLSALAQHPDAKWETRWFAIRILGQLRHPSIPAILVDLLQFIEPDLESEEEEDLSTALMDALAQQGTASIAVLANLLNASTTRLKAAQVLAQIRTSVTIAPLLSIVDDPDPAIRAIALEALSSFHHPAIPPLLLQALGDRNSTIRRIAIEGLGMRPDLANTYHLVQVLSDYLWDIKIEVCQQAALSLGRFKQATAIPPLIKCFRTPHTPIELQLTLVRAIAWIPSAEALSALKTMLMEKGVGSTTPVLTEIASVLGQVQQDPEQAAAIAMQALESSDTHLKATTIRQALILSLGLLQQTQAAALLVKCLSDPDPGIQLHARAALKQLASAAPAQKQ